MNFNLSMQRHEEQRRWLLEIYQAALEAVAGDRVVQAWLQDHPQRVPPGLVAIGKAAERMAAGALDSLGTGVPAALVVLKSGQREGLLDGYPDVQVIESDHPVPGAASLAAGKALLKFLEAQPLERRLMFLLSGGASSLVEVPEPGIDLGLLQRTNAWLLGSGLDIARMNAVRQRLSAIKGGKLLRWLQGRPVEVLLISDVRGDDPAIIRCPPWRAKRRRVVPGSREATRDTRRAEGAKGDPKGASERGVQSYGRPVCSRNELAMLWRNAG